MSTAEKERYIRLRQKVSRVGLVLMIVVLVWYLYLTGGKEGAGASPQRFRGGRLRELKGSRNGTQSAIGKA